MKSRFVDFSGLEALGVNPEMVLQGDQAKVIEHENDFGWLVKQAEDWYLERHGRLPDPSDPDHFSHWGHKELFDMVFACAKEGLATSDAE